MSKPSVVAQGSGFFEEARALLLAGYAKGVGLSRSDRQGGGGFAMRAGGFTCDGATAPERRSAVRLRMEASDRF